MLSYLAKLLLKGTPAIITMSPRTDLNDGDMVIIAGVPFRRSFAK